MIEDKEKEPELKSIQQTQTEQPQSEEQLLLAEFHQIMGRIQMARYSENWHHGATFLLLKRIKDTEIYKQIPEIKTWENLCKLTGWSRRKINEMFQNINVFGEEFWAQQCQLGLTITDFRRLRQLPPEELQNLIDGKNEEEIKAVIEDLKIKNQQANKEKQKAKRKMEKLSKENKELRKLNKQLEDKAEQPKREAIFLLNLKRAQNSFAETQEYLLAINPETVSVDAQKKFLKKVDLFKRAMISFDEFWNKKLAIYDNKSQVE